MMHGQKNIKLYMAMCHRRQQT